MGAVEAVLAIRDDLRTLPGIAPLPWTGPDPPVEGPVERNPTDGVTLVVYTTEGYQRLGSANGGNGRPMFWGVHQLTIRLSVPHKEIGRDYARLMPFVDDVPRAFLAGFARDRFGGTVNLLSDPRTGVGAAAQPLTYAFEGGDTGGVPELVLRFTGTIAVEDELPLVVG